MIRTGQQLPLKPAADESCCLEHGGQQGFLPGALPGCRGARLPDCRGAFRLTELGFLEESMSHSLSFVGCKRGIRRSTAPGAGAAPIQLHTGQRGTGESWSIPGGWAAGEGLAWHPYLPACAAGTAAPCRCPGGWQSGSPSGHRTSHPLTSSAHCRAGVVGAVRGSRDCQLCPNPPSVLSQPKNKGTMGKISR